MAVRKPLVMIGGVVRGLPAGDSIAGAGEGGGGGGSGIIVPPISTTATYDAAGRVHAVTDTFAGGRVSVATVAYTPQGAVSSVTTTSGSSTRTETYTYNPDGSFAAMSTT